MGNKILEAVQFGNNVIVRGDKVIVNEADKDSKLFGHLYAEHGLAEAQPLIDDKTLVVDGNGKVYLNACW